jgi:hypothetical protein
MKTHIKFLLFVLLLQFPVGHNILTYGFVPAGGDTTVKIITADQGNPYFISPFITQVIPGKNIKFIASNGEFAIFFRHADQFFEGVSSNVEINVNSDGEAESDLYTVLSDLPVGTEIKYEVYCITTRTWILAPPRIIIVPPDDQD